MSRRDAPLAIFRAPSLKPPASAQKALGLSVFLGSQNHHGTCLIAGETQRPSSASGLGA
jgi:hypothetical protein